MLINTELLDMLTAQAQASPRLRMNFDLRNSPADQSQHSLECLETGTVILETKDGAFEPMREEDIMLKNDRRHEK